MVRRNIRLLIAYDGTNYQGWQRQKEAPTIQGTIEGVLTKITREATTLNGAGRTDSGVHAWGQVANFSTSSPLTVPKFYQALNALLPEDVVIREVSEAAEGFHARFSSRAKVYDYLIWNTPRLLFFRPYVCFIREKLDLERMSAGLSRLIGERDFSSFQSQGSQVSHPVRQLVPGRSLAPSLRLDPAAIQGQRVSPAHGSEYGRDPDPIGLREDLYSGI